MMTESILLEPYYRFVLEVPSENVGRALADLDLAGASFSSPHVEGQTAVITGRGPVSSLKDYPRDLAAYTRGQGHLQLTGDGYDICRNAEEVIRAKGYDPLADVRNTPDSVFCTHGSGYIVPYDEVYRHLHTPLGGYFAGYLPKELLSAGKGGDVPEGAGQGRTEEPNRSIGTKEIDEIISRISGSNRKEDRKGRDGKFRKKQFGTAVKGQAAYAAGTGQMGNLIAKKTGTPGSSGAAGLFTLEAADHILVDGYNVIFAWQEFSDLARVNIDAARDALIDLLSELNSMVAGKVTVVFDAYRVKGHSSERMTLQDVQVLFTSEEETADQYIERFTNENRKKSRIAVVTSDGLEQVITRGQGCLLISSRELKEQMEHLRSTMREKYDFLKG